MQRIRQSAAATIQVVFTDQYGTPTEPGGAVTVTITRANGDSVVSAGATTSGSTGVRKYQLTAAQTAQLDVLTAAWVDASTSATWTTYHRVVGGFVFLLSEARASNDVLADTAKYPDTLLAAKRDEVEEELEWICDRSVVPSFARVTVDGTGTNRISTGLHDIRTLRAITTYDTVGGTGVALSGGDLAAISSFPNGDLCRTDGSVFPFGVGNVVVEAEYGLNGADSQLATAALTRLRSLVTVGVSQIPERTRSWTDPHGNTYQFTGPDAYRTGIDSVDAVYMRYSLRAQTSTDQPGRGAGHRPASGTITFDPQHGGLFRGVPR